MSDNGSEEFKRDYSDDEPLDDYEIPEDDIGGSDTLLKLKDRQSSVIYMDLNDVISRLKKIIKELSELLGTDDDETLILFHHFRWNKNKLETSDYFANPDKIREHAGLVPLSKVIKKPSGEKFHCPICWDEVSTETLEALSCGHFLCSSCWDTFIKEKIYDKNEGGFWRCPTAKCSLILPDSFNKKHIPPENMIAYEKKIAMSYAEENKAIKWCPAPDCKFCVENPSLISRPILCRCGYLYCFKCCREDHRPCECSTADAWTSKNANESANTKWILINTKKCPECRHPIEKNQGCNHMTCRFKGCGYEFCWLCLAKWENSHYSCSTFAKMTEEEKKKLQQDVDREKSELEKYIYFFERYHNHDTGFKVAQKLYKNTENQMLELHDNYSLQHGEVLFLNEAGKVLVECKRVLKWSYSFGYYLQDKHRGLYEFSQKDLERFSEELLESLEMHYKTEIRTELGKLDLPRFAKYKNEVMTLKDRCQKFLTGFLGQIDQSWLIRTK